MAVLGQDQYDRMGYAYDGANQLTRIDYPAGLSVRYTRNAAGQVSGIDLQVGGNAPTSLASQISYLPFGPLNSLTWGNGISLNRQYDQDYRLRQQQVGAWQSDYDHDANGNIIELAHSLWGSLQYDYDALDRLTLEQRTAEKKTYDYDAVGNRIGRTTYSLNDGQESQTAQQTLIYEANSNRLSKRNSTYDVEVDAAGHYTRYSQNRRYGYDEQGRLNRVTDADGVLKASYRYNALGQRTVKDVQGAGVIYPYTYLYGPDGQLLGQLQYTHTGKAKLGHYWVWLEQTPLAQIQVTYAADGIGIANTHVIYLHADHLNTPRLASNQSQQLLWSWDSDAFGVGLPNQDVDGDGVQTDIPLRFPGQIADAHSALYYNYFRDYDPETGRYVESDPIGLRGGLNTYGYVEGNPVNYLDPLGLAKGGNGNQTDSGLTHLSDEEVSDKARDRNLTGEERRRYQKEEKARGKRNAEKRRNNKGGMRSEASPSIPGEGMDPTSCPSGNCQPGSRLEVDPATGSLILILIFVCSWVAG